MHSEIASFAAKIIFVAALLASASGFVSPPIALAAGIVFGLCFLHPYASASRSASRFLLQASVVALGFGMNLHEVLKAGRSGFVYTALGISFAIAVGLTLGKFLDVRGKSSFLITAGTAICGGSAIAAIGPIVQADEQEMAVSLGTIFILNSVALLIFPGIGGLLHMTQQQFGLWAALAIHDTSSVVGAAAKYGTIALIVGTTVKLARALWIVPLALGAAAVKRQSLCTERRLGAADAADRRVEIADAPEFPITADGTAGIAAASELSAEANAAITEPSATQMAVKAEIMAGETDTRVRLPWFILFFCLAAIVNTYVPGFGPAGKSLFGLGRIGLTVTLFLIGTGISWKILKGVGWRPLVQGILLWIAVGVTSLYLIHAGFISL